MSDAVLIQLIQGTTALIIALATLFSSLWNGAKLSKVETKTNGMADRLERAAFAEGKQSERDNPTLAAPAAGNPLAIPPAAKKQTP